MAAELVEAMLGLPDVAHVRQPQYRATLWRWATAQARADLVQAALTEHGDCTGCERCTSWERRWLAFASTLTMLAGASGGIHCPVPGWAET